MNVTINKIIPVCEPKHSDEGRWATSINCLKVEYTIESENSTIIGTLDFTCDEYFRFSIAQLKEDVIQHIRSF